MYLNQDNLHVETSSTGARITTLQLGAEHFFYPQQFVEKDLGIVKRGGMHICSPVFGPSEGKGIFSKAPQHGELRDIIWDSRVSPDAPIHNNVTYSSRYKKWGADLLYGVDYLVKENRLSICAGVTNCGLKPTTIELGLHPYFNAPNGGRITFSSSELAGSPIEINSAYGPKIFPACEVIEILLHGIGLVKIRLGHLFKDGFVCVWTDWRRKYFCAELLLTYEDYSPGVVLDSGEQLKALLSMSFNHS